MSAFELIIKSPVCRHLVVRDIGASIAFYTNRLGFRSVNASETEMPYPGVVYGPALIYFHTQAAAIESIGIMPQIGDTMVFFEVRGVARFYESLKQNGLQPTAPERVNWVKVEMFEVKDPDGYRLWFGESFHENPLEDIHTPVGKGQLRQIMPAFPCENVPAAVYFYRQVMGFSVNYEQNDLGVLDRDSVRLLLIAKTQQEPGPASCCVYIRNADELYQELKMKGANLPRKPVSQPWGLREFEAIDLDNNRITFAQTFE